jgi:ribosomal protein S18 acetylase RimI-like enzyme
MQVSVRTARPAEFDVVGDITVAAYRSLPVDHLWGGYEADIRDVAGRAKSSDVLVAVDQHDAVRGAVTFVSDPESRWLEWTEPGELQFRLLAVDVSARAHGIGAALVRGCLERAGNRPVVIHTTRWMEAAQRLYERLGFVRRGDRDVPYAEWFDPARDHDLPREWIGASFLAYAFSPAG